MKVTRDPLSPAPGNSEPPAHADAPTESGRPTSHQAVFVDGQPRLLRIRGTFLRKLPSVTDARGTLSFAETGQHIPFPVARYFTLSDVPPGETRGEHAHRECQQFIVCLRGSCTAAVDDGLTREELTLQSKTVGLYLPRLIWCVLFDFSNDATVLVLASQPYGEDDYIRRYDEFLTLTAQ